jgi:cytochrome b561
VVNWLLIIFLMLAAFTGDVAPNLRENAAQPRYLVPGVHTLFGLPAQLLATFIVLRMLWEDWQVARAKGRGETDLQRYWFKPAKWIMRLTLALWIITASLGIVSYLVRYNVINIGDTIVPAPAATEEAGQPSEPAATEEAN